MKTLFYKPQSVGQSVSFCQPALKVCHVLFELTELPRDLLVKGYQAVLIGEVSLVEYLEPHAVKVEKARDVVVTHQCFSNVVDLSAGVFACGVRQKQDLIEAVGPRRDADESLIWSLPDGVELSLDVNPRHLPQRPARQRMTAVCSHLLFNDGETFIEWLAGQWLALHQHGGIALHELVA